MPEDCPVFTARPDGAASLIGLAHHRWGDQPDMIYGEIPLDQQRANVNLIAAAPDLLAALKACHLQMLQSSNDSEYAQEANQLAIAATAKAEGR